MSEATTPPVDTGVTPPADTGTPPVEQSNLPSDNVEQTFDGFAITDELKAKFKDGKLNGRFESIDDVLGTLKSIEDKYANLNRELSDAEKAQVAEVQQTQEQMQTETKRLDTIRELVPAFMENGMQLTPEMTAKLTEAGLTESEIKLGAYEMKETLSTHHEMMGGKENYDIVMAYHAEKMTDEQKIAFNNDIQSGNHSEALMLGLQAMYEKGVGHQEPSEPQDRFRGDNQANSSAKGYETKAQLFADKKYIDSPAGQKDAGAIARYRAKLAVTDSKVYGM